MLQPKYYLLGVIKFYSRISSTDWLRRKANITCTIQKPVRDKIRRGKILVYTLRIVPDTNATITLLKNNLKIMNV